MLVPLTGPSANIGDALLDAAQLALFDVGDERLTLLPKDTGGTPEGAARAAEEAVAEGAELILGPLFSQSVAAAAPTARRHGVNMIAFSTDRDVAGQGVYLFGFLPREQIDRVIDHAVDQGLMRFAALVPETAYGDAILDALSAATARRGAQIIQVETYPDTGENPHEAVRRLADYEQRKKALEDERERIGELDETEAEPLLAELEGLETLGELEYDAVILPEGGDRLRSVALLLPYYDIDPATIRFIGTGLWDDENIGREPALVGGWFAGVPPKLSRAFANRFATVYGDRPPRIASIAYDSLALAALLADESTTDAGQRFSAQRITAATGFAGANGLFRLRNEGLTERGLAVVEVGRTGTRVIDPPPDAFPVTTLGSVGSGYGGPSLSPSLSPGAPNSRAPIYP
jgi:branched-chain amino acid transport system substrate-binding protein